MIYWIEEVMEVAPNKSYIKKYKKEFETYKEAKNYLSIRGIENYINLTDMGFVEIKLDEQSYEFLKEYLPKIVRTEEI